MFEVFLPAAVALVLVVVLTILSRTRRQPRSAAREPRRNVKGQQGEIEDESRRDEEMQKAEEKRKQVDEEAQRKAEEEEQHRRKQAEDQRQRLDAEERQLEENSEKAEEERKRLEEETGGKPAGTQPEQEGTRLEPENRGGRPRQRTRQPREKRPGHTIGPRRLKPEVVCWKRERQWILAVEVPDDLRDQHGLELSQNGSILRQDESSEDCWRIEELAGQVEVHWTENHINRKLDIALGDEGYLLFKLSGQTRGRRVRFPSSGSYLAVVPDEWQRDDVLSGPAPAAPEPTSIIRYHGHYFDVERDNDRRLAFRRVGGTQFFINPKKLQFELVGHRLNDASEDMGPLFGEKPPQIHACDPQAWKDLKTVLVGEEGPGKGRWRDTFTPVMELIEQDLPSEVTARKAGWYFVRFYDANGDLVESLQFRFVDRLQGIKVHQASPLPLDGGHTAVTVEFSHEPDCCIQPADDLAGSVLMDHHHDKTILTIPPDPLRDKTHWLIGSQHEPKVQVTILLERIWWALGQEDAEPSEWTDRPLTLQRDHFAATSRVVLWLRLARQRWTREVLFGFQTQTARRYKPKVADNTLAIPLRDFGDAEELQALGRRRLKLGISSQGTMHTAVVCDFIVKLACKSCDFSTTEQRHILSHVESQHITEFIQALTYEDLRGRVPSLPPGIYKCLYCDFYVKSDDPDNPTSTIIRHQEENCRKARESARLRGGAVQVRFGPIFDVDEIRENVISNLPRIYKCNLCGFELDDPTEGEEMHHLRDDHENVLYVAR